LKYELEEMAEKHGSLACSRSLLTNGNSCFVDLIPQVLAVFQISDFTENGYL